MHSHDHCPAMFTLAAQLRTLGRKYCVYSLDYYDVYV